MSDAKRIVRGLEVCGYYTEPHRYGGGANRPEETLQASVRGELTVNRIAYKLDSILTLERWPSGWRVRPGNIWIQRVVSSTAGATSTAQSAIWQTLNGIGEDHVSSPVLLATLRLEIAQAAEDRVGRDLGRAEETLANLREEYGNAQQATFDAQQALDILGR